MNKFMKTKVFSIPEKQDFLKNTISVLRDDQKNERNKKISARGIKL